MSTGDRRLTYRANREADTGNLMEAQPRGAGRHPLEVAAGARRC